MIDVALPKATDPTVQDCLQTAKGSADLLLTLLNDLLDSAKIESGKLELESAPFSLRRMLDQITRVLSVRASEKGLCFYCRMPDETPDAVDGRPDAIAASPAQSGRERHQVHRARRRGDQSSRPVAGRRSLPGVCRAGHRNRHPAFRPGASLPALRPGRRFHGAAFRRHGPRAFHLARAWWR